MKKDGESLDCVNETQQKYLGRLIRGNKRKEFNCLDIVSVQGLTPFQSFYPKYIPVPIFSSHMQQFSHSPLPVLLVERGKPLFCKPRSTSKTLSIASSPSAAGSFVATASLLYNSVPDGDSNIQKLTPLLFRLEREPNGASTCRTGNRVPHHANTEAKRKRGYLDKYAGLQCGGLEDVLSFHECLDAEIEASAQLRC